MSMKISVLIVDDHPIVRDGLATLLANVPDIELDGTAESGEAALDILKLRPVDVVLMDLNMPGIGGTETTRQIRELSPGTKVVVLTSHTEDSMVLAAIKAGAFSYLLKSSKGDEVIDGIRAAMAGEARLHPSIAKMLMNEASGANPKQVEMLTERELEVLKLIAEGLDNQSIASALTISEKTVKVHVSNILSKLHLNDRTQAAIFALRNQIVPLNED